MEMELLREFAILGKTLNFTKAAQQLSLDQSTLSRHLQSLEREVGAELIARTSRKVKLTKAGELFLGETIDMLERFDEAVLRVRELAKPQVLNLVVGGALIGGSIANLITRAKVHVKRHGLPINVKLYEPHMSSSLTTLSMSDPIEDLMCGNVDMAVLFGATEEELSRLRHELLFYDDLVLFVDEQHPLAGRSSVRLMDLKPFTVRVSSFYERNAEWMKKICQDSGFALKTRTKVVDSVSTWCMSYGPDDAFMYNGSAASVVLPVEVSGLVMVPFDDPKARFEARAVWRPDDDNPAIPALLEVLHQIAAAPEFGGV